MRLFNRWTVKKSHFWLAIGLGIPVLCVLVFLGFFIVSPRMGGADSAYFYEGNYDLGSPPMEAADEAYFAEMEESGFTADSPTSIDTVASNSGAAVVERLIIREGNITIAVEDTRASRDAIEEIVMGLAEDGAFVVSSSESGRGENRQPYVNMSIRVPVERFSAVMDQLAEMGVRVDERYETAQDVTEEYVDVAGRIEAAEISIERLKELMAGAEFTEDLLNAEEQLSRREAELEALRGRLNFLAESAALSLIHINLSPYELSEPIDTSWKPAETFRRAVEDLLESLQNFADFMIVFLVAVLPWLLFFGLIIWGVVALVRRRRRKKAGGEEKSSS
jgi:hypothetical protein